MGNDTSPTDPQGQTPNGEASPGQTPTAESQTANGQQQTPLTSLPPDVQDYIKRLRTEAEKANDKEKAEAKARQKAEEERLKEQGEYKKLAEQHQARVAELEPVAERYGKLAEQVRASVQAETKHWPAEIRAFYPGDDAPVEQLNDWFERSKPLIAKLQEQQKGSNPGNRPNPTPSGGTPETAQAKFREQLRRSGKYGG